MSSLSTFVGTAAASGDPPTSPRRPSVPSMWSRSSRRWGSGRCTIVGQSFGGHIGFLVAATTPAVVSSLIVIEADPDPPAPAHVDRVRSGSNSWPIPFLSEEAAMAFFAPNSSPETWVAGLEARDGGYWPRFDASVLIAALDGIARRSWWHDWMRITAPTLVIRGDRGGYPRPRRPRGWQPLSNMRTRSRRRPLATTSISTSRSLWRRPCVVRRSPTGAPLKRLIGHGGVGQPP